MGMLDSSRKRWLFVGTLYMLSIMYVLFQGGKTSLMLFVVFNLLLFYLIIGRWSGIRKVTGDRVLESSHNSSGGALTTSSTLDVTIQVRIPGYYPLSYIIVKDHLRRHNGQLLTFETSLVPDLRRRGQAHYQTPPLQRGEYQFENTECRTSDIFGLFDHFGTFSSPRVFRVLPQTVELRQWHVLRRGIRGPYSHTAAARAAKETTQINGVREYLHGDKLSRIHWNATARTGEWKSKEFERESLPRTMLILDCNQMEGATASAFELAVSVAASFVESGMRGDTSMGLLQLREKSICIPSGSGYDQKGLLQKQLVLADTSGKQSLYSSLRQADQMLESGAVAIVISQEQGEGALQSAEWLLRKGLSPVYIYIQGSATLPVKNRGWMKAMQEKGVTLLPIRDLQELPLALEGSEYAS